jgi:hypothetical protein
MPENTPSLESLDDSQLAYLFRAFFIDSGPVPLDAAIGNLTLLNMQ